MKELVDLLTEHWSALLGVLVIFGFAPRLMLRVLVVAFPRDDVRRRELLGELDGIPYKDRPLFVAEQFEVALVEGIGGRVRWLWIRKVTERWSLADGAQRSRDNPDTFYVPSPGEKLQVKPGHLVKIAFQTRSGWGERMWVKVIKKTRRGYIGELSNVPVGIPDLWAEKEIRFRGKHIIDIDLVDEDDPGT